jgi:hypothetical protein
LTLKLKVLPLQLIEPKKDELRPSSQVNNCKAEMTGTPRLCAEETTAGAIPGELP